MDIKNFVDINLKDRLNRINSNRISEKWIKKYHIETYNYIIEKTKYFDSISFPERIYLLYNNITVKPNGKYICFSDGYREPHKKINRTSIEQFLNRNKRRNKHLWFDNKIEGIDYIVCPVTGTRLSMLKKNYIEKTLCIPYDVFVKQYPNQQMICNKRIENIRNGLKKIDIETGLTKHALSNKKRVITLNKIGDDGLTGYERYLKKTKESNLNNIIDGKNGYQRTAYTRNNTILKNGLTIQQNGILKNIEKQENSKRISVNRKKYSFKVYGQLIRSLSRKEVIKMKHTGFETDHIYSISKGYDNKISPLILANKNNLQLLTFIENRRKYTNNNITIDDLLERTNTSKEQNDLEFNIFIDICDINKTPLQIYKRMLKKLNECNKK